MKRKILLLTKLDEKVIKERSECFHVESLESSLQTKKWEGNKLAIRPSMELVSKLHKIRARSYHHSHVHTNPVKHLQKYLLKFSLIIVNLYHRFELILAPVIYENGENQKPKYKNP